MRHVLFLTAALSLSTPAVAQDDSGGLRDGLGLLGEGSRMILEGLLNEMRPMLEEVQPFLEEEVVPMLERMGEIVDDLSHYELPERLPNGDILIRRSPEAPPFGREPLPEVGEGGEVEL
ncbi:hypothetical protein [Roseicyclus mahoneyensis]|uniref:AAA+ family ATPase n=1 Tax=Roseicyclus mahoneyensis TaxID=164332 RepID=A0A316GK66_9RHOB|nr:hypothetical protein [Roseicyclus mahoneyensis]PWK60955.1 hypothetical protein C7455_103155 [Roseicyclus mahoneyensis]